MDSVQPYIVDHLNLWEKSGMLQEERRIPYARQSIDESDIRAVVETLCSDFLTTGPKVAEFEKALAGFVGAKEAVAVSSGTAALHTAVYAAGIKAGDEVIVPPLTFVATANAVVYQGAVPVFCDVESDTLLLDPKQVESKITPKTKAIIAVDYAGHPCDYDALKEIADHHGLILISDACHALGAEYKGTKTGALADLTVFSFHPAKHITTGEGGMIVTDNIKLAEKMQRFRNHGINMDHKLRSQQGTWHYDVEDLGHNYRITDFQCALGISQLKRLPEFVERRREIAKFYNEAFAKTPNITPLTVRASVSHAYHLYVVKINFNVLGINRAKAFKDMRLKNIALNVHYIPVHLHPFYRNKFKTGPGLCPAAEDAYEQIITLPMFCGMTDREVARVIKNLTKLINDSC